MINRILGHSAISVVATEDWHTDGLFLLGDAIWPTPRRFIARFKTTTSRTRIGRNRSAVLSLLYDVFQQNGFAATLKEEWGIR